MAERKSRTTIEWESEVELGRLGRMLHLPRRLLGIGQIPHEGVITRFERRKMAGGGSISMGGAPVVIPGSLKWVYLDDADEPIGWVAGPKAGKVRKGEYVLAKVDPYDGYIGKWKPRDRKIPWYNH